MKGHARGARFGDPTAAPTTGQAVTTDFLDSIALTRTLPCPADPGRIIVVGRPSRGMAEVLPYLASLPNALAYNPEAVALTLRRDPGFITFYDQIVYITKVGGLDEGLALLEVLTEAVNTIWQHRSKLNPVTSRRRAPAMLDLWALLPHTNCGQCGVPTHELHVCTDDGSYGHHGFVTDVLKKVLQNETIKLVVAIGPVPMMIFVSKLTKEFNVPTLVSLNPIMVDGTGMCGGCRVTVGGQTKFACV